MIDSNRLFNDFQHLKVTSCQLISLLRYSHLYLVIIYKNAYIYGGPNIEILIWTGNGKV